MEIPPMEEIFGPGGVFARSFPGFEHRSSQTALAEEVRKILSDEEDGLSLAAEAPPGVGKTFALLAPAMLRAAAGGKTILVLTAGIPLQEQLIEKDLPALNSLLGLKLPSAFSRGGGTTPVFSGPRRRRIRVKTGGGICPSATEETPRQG